MTLVILFTLITNLALQNNQQLETRLQVFSVHHKQQYCIYHLVHDYIDNEFQYPILHKPFPAIQLNTSVPLNKCLCIRRFSVQNMNVIYLTST